MTYYELDTEGFAFLVGTPAVVRGIAKGRIRSMTTGGDAIDSSWFSSQGWVTFTERDVIGREIKESELA